MKDHGSKAMNRIGSKRRLVDVRPAGHQALPSGITPFAEVGDQPNSGNPGVSIVRNHRSPSFARTMLRSDGFAAVRSTTPKPDLWRRPNDNSPGELQAAEGARAFPQ